MAKTKIGVEISADDKASKDIKGVGGELRNLDKSAQKLKSNWKSALPGMTAVAVGLGAVAGGAKLAWEALDRGAVIKTTEYRFDRLAKTIGTTADALRTDLRGAIGMVMSDAEQMTLATDLMSLGLVKTHDEAIRLSGAAGKLGMDINQLVLALTNQSLKRFDQLGLSIDGFKERLAALKGQGMETDAAFRLAFIEQAEAQIEKVGDIADTASGKIATLTSTWKNAKDAFSTAFATGVIKGLGDIEDQADETAVKLAKVADLLGVIAGMSAGWLINTMVPSLQPLQDLGGNIIKQDNYTQGDIEALYNKYGETPPASVNLTMPSTMRALGMVPLGPENPNPPEGYSPSWEHQQKLMVEASSELTRLEEAGQAVIDQNEDIAGGWGGIGDAIEDANAELRAFAQGTGDLFARLEGQKEFDLARELFDLGNDAGFSARELRDLGVAGGLFDEGRGNELLGQTYQLEAAKALIDQGLRGEELVNAITSMDLGEAAAVADQFFKEIDDTIRPDLDTVEMDAAATAWADSQLLHIKAVVDMPGTGGDDDGPRPNLPPDAHSGRTVFADQPYIIKPDEELFIPTGGGSVKPFNQSGAMFSGGGGGGLTQTINIYDQAGLGLLRATQRLRRQKGADALMGLI